MIRLWETDESMPTPAGKVQAQVEEERRVAAERRVAVPVRVAEEDPAVALGPGADPGLPLEIR
jgi:hypothetical protein